jgi:HSP20 family molecular chaperone IbpA
MDITGQTFRGLATGRKGIGLEPAIELKEKDNEFRLQIATPGIDPKDLDLEVTPE